VSTSTKAAAIPVRLFNDFFVRAFVGRCRLVFVEAISSLSSSPRQFRTATARIVKPAGRVTKRSDRNAQFGVYIIERHGISAKLGNLLRRKVTLTGTCIVGRCVV
jgi:hypothetical protein